MQVKIMVGDVEKLVTIKGIKKQYRKEYLDRIISLEKLQEDDSLSSKEKIEKATSVFDWCEELALKYSDLTEEEKESLDIENSDLLRDAVKDLLDPVSERKKK